MVVRLVSNRNSIRSSNRSRGSSGSNSSHNVDRVGIASSTSSNPSSSPSPVLVISSSHTEKGKKKACNTQGSNVVPHRSTNCASWCLTSEFGWDPVFSPMYGRKPRD